MKPTRHANPRAGQGLLRSSVGRHTRNPGWKAGEHWVLCQRCGFDYYSKDMRKEWSGAIVCKTCWEPRHPQDFVRTRAERIQAVGIVNPDGLLNETAAAGSTEAPPPTFNLGDVISSGIPDQSYDSGEVITTITGAVFTPASYLDIYNETITISSYSAMNLPDNISISTSTGDMTGTLSTTSWQQTGIVTEVTALYSNGQSYSTTFTWTILEAGAAPDEIAEAADLCMWYDFSDDSKVYSDLAGTVLAGDDDRVRKVITSLPAGNAFQIDSSTEAPYFAFPESNSDGYAPTFSTNENGTLSAVDFDPALTDGGNQAILTPGWNPSGSNAKTYIGIVEVPTGQASSLASYFFGAKVSAGHNMGLSATNLGFKAELQSMDFNATKQTTTRFDGAWSLEVGNWFMFVFRQYVTNGFTDIKYTFNDKDLSAGAAVSHDWDDGTQGVARIGAGEGWGPPSSGTPEGPWNGHIGEILVYCTTLSDASVTELFKHFTAKWALTSTPP